jgi:hypothetical protein
MGSLIIENLSIVEELDVKTAATLCGGTSMRAGQSALMSGWSNSIGAGVVGTADAPTVPSESCSLNYSSLQIAYSQQNAR